MTKKTALWFGLVGYFLTVLYYFGPHGIASDEALLRILPFWVCILTGHGMPVLPVVFFIAPINADIYGVIGAVAGWTATKFTKKVSVGWLTIPTMYNTYHVL